MSWGSRGTLAIPLTLATLITLLCPVIASAAWMDNAWRYRREITIEAANGGGEELAEAEFYTLGLHQSSGTSIRVAGDDGKPVPARVLMIGPGDRMRVLFAPTKGVKRHFVYFGHPKPPAAPKSLTDFPIDCGILMEMRKLPGPLSNNFQGIEKSWGRANSLIGRMMVARLFLGYNPFDEEVTIISKYTGTLRAPQDGEYTFAASASDKGALYIDGKPVVFAPSNPGDVRFNAKLELKRGNHELVFYHENIAGEQRMTVAWKLPNSSRYELIPPAAFGVLPKTSVGPLQEVGKQFVADMKIEYQGECFYSDHYSHRYRFSAFMPPELTQAAIRYDWDFGDGQTASGPSVDHVFLADGEFPVKLTAKFGLQSDTRTNRLAVSRLYEHIENPPADLPTAQAKVLSTYDLSKLPAKWVPWAVLLFHRAKDASGMEKAAMRLAQMNPGVDVGFASTTLAAAADELGDQAKFDAAGRIWEAVPGSSACQPFAAKRYAELLLWRIGDFDKAVKVLEPYVKTHSLDRALKRSYAHALILSQKPAEGTKILQSIVAEGPPDRAGAMAGAISRTIEYYISDRDWEAGTAAWEKWQQEYPADFLEGYSVLLQTRLMEGAKAPAAAARLAEAFALAVPRSSYAPQLLDRASRLLQRSDPAKSKALRDLLKQKYPEDPLSQEPAK